MRTVFSICVIVLALTVAFSFLPVSGEENVYDSVVRLHVIANSDSEADQAHKLAVRDAVLELVSRELEGEDSVDGATGRIGSLLGEIERVSRETLDARGCSYAVRAEFGREVYPEREYEGYSLPGGEYVSLRVVIGAGDGRNWWCVLFPPICTGAAQRRDFIEAGLTSEGYNMITDVEKPRYKVKFRILEILSDVFGGNLFGN